MGGHGSGSYPGLYHRKSARRGKCTCYQIVTFPLIAVPFHPFLCITPTLEPNLPWFALIVLQALGAYAGGKVGSVRDAKGKVGPVLKTARLG